MRLLLVALLAMTVAARPQRPRANAPRDCNAWVDESGPRGVTHRVRQCDGDGNSVRMEAQFINTSTEQVSFKFRVMRYPASCSGPDDDLSEKWWGAYTLDAGQMGEVYGLMIPANHGRMQTCYRFD